jgi:hypothetical protein
MGLVLAARQSRAEKVMAINKQIEIKAEQIARMRAADIPKAKIAHAMDLTYPGLKRIMDTPEYEAIEKRVFQGVKDYMDERLKQRINERIKLGEDMEDAVSDAVKVLLDALRNKKDFRAALEVLDRDPKHSFGKGSRQMERAEAPAISAEALSSAIKEADVTQKIMKSVERISSDQPIAKA